MKIGINPIFGIEIECAYNSELIGEIQIDGHHSRDGNATYSNGFYCEYDSSINTREQYRGAAEIISVPFQLDQFNRIINGFKSHTMGRINNLTQTPLIFRTTASKTPEIELAEAFDFNPSTGCHIHITPLLESNDKYYVTFKGKRFNFKGKPIRIKHLVTTKFLALFRKRLFKRIKDELPKLSDKFEKHYYRDRFATKFDDLEQLKQERYHEFNLTHQDTRMEFRSFHLCGVETWSDFRSVLRIVLEVIKDTFEYEINKEEAFSESDSIDLKKPLLDYAYKERINERVVEQDVNLNEVYLDVEEDAPIGDILTCID